MMDYYEIFKEIGIVPNSLPESYDPDEYARILMKDAIMPGDVTYSTSTKSVIQTEEVICYK